jgi:hypothetical protein
MITTFLECQNFADVIVEHFDNELNLPVLLEQLQMGVFLFRIIKGTFYDKLFNKCLQYYLVLFLVFLFGLFAN